MLQSFKTFLKALSSPPSPEDVASVLARSGAGVLITAVNALVYTISSIQESNLGFLVAWLCSALLLCSVLYLRSRRATGQRVKRVSRKAARRLIVFAVLLALPWSSLALYSIGFGTTSNQVVVYLICAGMSAGGTFILYRALAACSSFYATILSAVAVGSFIKGGPEAVPVLIFSLIYLGSLAYFAFGVGQTARQRDASVAALSEAVYELQTAQKENFRLAFVDPVTGLPNRKSFMDALQEFTGNFLQGGRPFALLMFDLDRFKNINDTFGHTVGDELLKLVGERLREFGVSGNMVARLGGDEFAVLLPDVSDREAITEFSANLMERLKDSASLAGRMVYTGASVGIALCPEHGTSPEQLMLNADLALNSVKEKGRGDCVIFNEPLRDRIIQNDWLEQELRLALDRRQISVSYQPKMSLVSDQLVGAEALVRWTHAEEGPISPEVFLHVAAERGLLPVLSSHIADTIIADILGWRAAGVLYPTIAMNIHPVDFRSPEFLLSTISKFDSSGISSRDIMLEITEGCFMGRGTDSALFILDELVDRGFELSLDDFGTGHASLSHLKKLPVAEIKIDRSFVQGIVKSQKDKSIVAATAEIARGMGIRSVAEGVENEAQKEIVVELGVDIGQGYLWSKPLTSMDFATFVQDRSAGRARDGTVIGLRKRSRR